MAKMTRDSLKSLVKECLFEILLEATDSSGQLIEAKRTPSRTRRNNSVPSNSRRPALDKIVTVAKNKPKPDLDVSSITSDPVMAAIFQDTAATTLVEQARAESQPGRALPGGIDAAARVVAQNEPSDIFGDAAKNWAALAFNE